MERLNPHTKANRTGRQAGRHDGRCAARRRLPVVAQKHGLTKGVEEVRTKTCPSSTADRRVHHAKALHQMPAPGSAEKKKKKKQLRRDEEAHLAPESVEKFPDGIPPQRKTLMQSGPHTLLPAVLISLLLLSLLVFVAIGMPESNAEAQLSQSSASSIRATAALMPSPQARRRRQQSFRRLLRLRQSLHLHSLLLRPLRCHHRRRRRHHPTLHHRHRQSRRRRRLTLSHGSTRAARIAGGMATARRRWTSRMATRSLA